MPGWLTCIDESMVCWTGNGMPHVSFVPRKPEPLGCELKNTCDATTGCMLFLEIQVLCGTCVYSHLATVLRGSGFFFGLFFDPFTRDAFLYWCPFPPPPPPPLPPLSSPPPRSPLSPLPPLSPLSPWAACCMPSAFHRFSSATSCVLMCAPPPSAARHLCTAATLHRAAALSRAYQVRKQLRHHPLVLGQLHRWWDASLRGASEAEQSEGLLGKEEYVQLSLKMSKVRHGVAAQLQR